MGEKDIDKIEPHNRELFETGKAMSANDYVRALNLVRTFYGGFIKFWDSYDLPALTGLRCASAPGEIRCRVHGRQI